VSFYEEERNIMARANNEWITRVHYAFQDQHNLYMAMDFHSGGDLLSLINRYCCTFYMNLRCAKWCLTLVQV